MQLSEHNQEQNLYRHMLEKRTDDLFKGKATDFSTRYLALFQLRSSLETHPENIDDEVICDIQSVLLEQAYDHQRQGYFLYREAAETLSACVVHAAVKTTAQRALDALVEVLAKTAGPAHRAAAETLGSFPVRLQGPEFVEPEPALLPRIRWDELLRQTGLVTNGDHVFIGRSLVSRCVKSERILVCKLARSVDNPVTLQREALWMEHLKSRCHSFPLRFDIPEPLKIGDGFVFRISGLPPEPDSGETLHPGRYAIGFVSHEDYYSYPNDTSPERHLDDNRLLEVMSRNAWILGKMTSMGIVHDALIPLFHNRTQGGRRSDQGVYQWIRAGRLDRWLYSCEYPNIGLSGVRDFEHLLAVRGRHPRLYRKVGDHLLSLLLVTASHFRNRDPGLMGLDCGRPVDARHLFDKKTLKASVIGIFSSYYEGFVGAGYTGAIPFDPDLLSERMIAEMGVDRYMEELVRVADQEAMTDREFNLFLNGRGVLTEKIATLEKGVEDIVIHSGPHLGAFNDAISIPELLDGVGSMAALCVSGRYWKNRLAVSKK